MAARARCGTFTRLLRRLGASSVSSPKPPMASATSASRPKSSRATAVSNRTGDATPLRSAARACSPTSLSTPTAWILPTRRSSTPSASRAASASATTARSALCRRCAGGSLSTIPSATWSRILSSNRQSAVGSRLKRRPRRQSSKLTTATADECYGGSPSALRTEERRMWKVCGSGCALVSTLSSALA